MVRGVCLIMLALIIMMLFARFKPHRRVPLLARLDRWLQRLFVQLSLRSKGKQLLGFYQIATRVGDVYKVGFLLCLLCLLRLLYSLTVASQGSDARGGGAAAILL